LENKDYDATLSKLDEAGEVINQVNTGEIKGDFATSSEAVDLEPAEFEEDYVLGAEEEATTTTIKN